MKTINEQIEKTDQQIQELQNKRKLLLSKQKEEERKARTHRLIERGAILESMLNQPEQYENDDIKTLLKIAFDTSQVKEHLDKIGDKNEAV